MIPSIPVAFFFGGAPSTPEMMFVLLAVLLLFGAKRLPEIARNLGRSMEEFRRAARDVTDEIMNADKAPLKPPGRCRPRRRSRCPLRARWNSRKQSRCPPRFGGFRGAGTRPAGPGAGARPAG